MASEWFSLLDTASFPALAALHLTPLNCLLSCTHLTSTLIKRNERVAEHGHFDRSLGKRNSQSKQLKGVVGTAASIVLIIEVANRK